MAIPTLAHTETMVLRTEETKYNKTSSRGRHQFFWVNDLYKKPSTYSFIQLKCRKSKEGKKQGRRKERGSRAVQGLPLHRVLRPEARPLWRLPMSTDQFHLLAISPHSATLGFITHPQKLTFKLSLVTRIPSAWSFTGRPVWDVIYYSIMIHIKYLGFFKNSPFSLVSSKNTFLF